MTLSTALGFIGAGDVYLTPILAGGTFGKKVDVGNTTKLGIKANTVLKQQKSKKRDSFGQVLENVALLDPAELAMTLETVNRTGLRYAFCGEDLAYTQTGATITDEVVIMQLEGWVQLAHEALGATVVLTNTGATVTYVEGVDYELNRRLGWVRGLLGGAITDLQSCKIDYVSTTFAGAAIRGSVNPQIRALVELDGINKVDDSIGILRCWEVVLAPTSEFDWFKDDFNTIDLAGKLKTPAGKTEPFVYYTR
jgi:hypothetical protein